MSLFSRVTFAVLAHGMCVLGTSAQAANLYVAPTGAPYSSISSAVNAASYGDTVVVADGTYNETVNLKSGVNLKSQNKWGAKVRGDWDAIVAYANGSGDDTRQTWPDARYVVSNLTIDGFDVQARNGGIFLKWTHHITVKNCRAHNCALGGIGANFSDYITFEDNEVSNCGRTNSHGGSGMGLFKVRPWDQNGGYHNVIQRNRCYNNGQDWRFLDRAYEGNGIILDTVRFNVSALVANNLCYNNGGNGISLPGAKNVDVFHNTCYQNGWDTRIERMEIQIQRLTWENVNDNPNTPRIGWNNQIENGPTENIRIRGNILCPRAGNAAIRSEGESSDSTIEISHNLLFNSLAPNGANFILEGTQIERGNPSFVFAPPAISRDNFYSVADPGAGNFHLNAQSLAIDKWSASPLVFDFDKTTRPQGAARDLGAYEYRRLAAGTYKILNRNSGKALDGVHNLNGQNDGANAQQWTYYGSANQQWVLTYPNGNFARLVNKATGKCLDIDRALTTNGANVQQWTDYGNTNQRFAVVFVGDGGYYKIEAQSSGKALDVAGYPGSAAQADGANVQQWDYSAAPNQQWSLEFVSSSTASNTSASAPPAATSPSSSGF